MVVLSAEHPVQDVVAWSRDGDAIQGFFRAVFSLSPNRTGVMSAHPAFHQVGVCWR